MLAPDALPAAAQLDLFVDGAETMLLHDLGAALRAGRREAAREALERLRARDPAHPDLTALERLCDATAPGLAAPTFGSALDALATEVDTVLLPAATRLLGEEGVVVLDPVWRRLAEGAADLRLDGPAGGGGAGRYWAGVAHYHLGGHRQARRLWLSLAWLDPAVLATHAPRCPDERVRRVIQGRRALQEVAPAFFPHYLRAVGR